MEDDALSLSNIPKRRLDYILHYLVMNELPYTGKAIRPLPFRGKRHYFALFQYYKNFQLAARMLGTVNRPAEGRKEQNIVARIKKK